MNLQLTADTFAPNLVFIAEVIDVEHLAVILNHAEFRICQADHPRMIICKLRKVIQIKMKVYFMLKLDPPRLVSLNQLDQEFNRFKVVVMSPDPLDFI